MCPARPLNHFDPPTSRRASRFDSLRDCDACKERDADRGARRGVMSEGTGTITFSGSRASLRARLGGWVRIFGVRGGVAGGLRFGSAAERDDLVDRKCDCPGDATERGRSVVIGLLRAGTGRGRNAIGRDASSCSKPISATFRSDPVRQHQPRH
jgi:hypothetical protein